MRVVLKVRRKGVLILPKRLREALGVNEGDEVLAEVVGRKVVLSALKPKVVDVNLELVEKILHEEYELERKRYARIVSSEKTGSRH